MSTKSLACANPLRNALAVTADPDLLDELLRLAAAAGVTLDVAVDPAAARSRYGPAPLVLVGLDSAQACQRASLPRRSEVVLVGRAEDGSEPPWTLAQALGATHVAMLPAAEPWLVDRLCDLAARRGAPAAAGVDGRGHVMAVIGGRGGAGASVLAAGLAVTAVRAGLRALLVDADPLGGGIDLVLGWEDIGGLRWPELREASGPVHPSSLVDALPRRGELVVLSWDRGEPVAVPPEAMAAAVDAGRRGRDLVVVDLPRRLDDSAAVALRGADRALLVVPAELRAAAAAARVAALASAHCASLGVVVRGPAPGRLRPREIARSLGLPLVGVLRPEPGLAPALERGATPADSGRGPLALLCRRLLTDLVPAATEAAA
ncbi:MAG TPA: septum site-determining protein Ssd [Micromonosporaceae bacterium]|nr:septum site-determining protein Ssd [Micromonosporaceae bacterium]